MIGCGHKGVDSLISGESVDTFLNEPFIRVNGVHGSTVNVHANVHATVDGENSAFLRPISPVHTVHTYKGIKRGKGNMGGIGHRRTRALEEFATLCVDVWTPRSGEPV